MDIFTFYTDILEDEVKKFNVSQEKLKNSLTAINNAYSPEALKNGKTFLDYNLPAHRCAYLFKFAPYHTELIFIFFRIFLTNAHEVYSTLKQKDELKICCLGGGGGTDIVGILRALVSFKCLRKKVSSVTVLDICGGWRNSFKKIIQKLKESQDVSDAFLNKETFSSKLVAVDLTETLSSSVINIIKSADIICMVKFVSAVISKPSAGAAFKNLASHMKPGAAVIFADNSSSKVYEPVNKVFMQAGLDCVFEPFHARFTLKGNYPVKLHLFGRSNFKSTCVSLVGWLKKSSVPCTDENFLLATQNVLCTESANVEDEDWKTFDDANDTTYGHCQPIEGSGDEDDYFSNGDSPSSVAESYSDQSTQTEVYSNMSSQYVGKSYSSHLQNQLTSLASRLDRLECLVKSLTVCSTGKCCGGPETSHNKGSPSSCLSDGLQNNGSDNCLENKCNDSHVFSPSLQNGNQCHRRANVHNTPFLVIPVSRQSALQTILFSGYSTE